jgi:hypothetical protein
MTVLWWRHLLYITVGLLWNAHFYVWVTVITNMLSFLSHQQKEVHQFFSSQIVAESYGFYIAFRMFSCAFLVVEIFWKIRRNWLPSKSVKNPAFSSSYTHLCSLCLIVGSISIWVYRWRYLPSYSFEICVLHVKTGKFMCFLRHSIHFCPNNLPIFDIFHLIPTLERLGLLRGWYP